MKKNVPSYISYPIIATLLGVLFIAIPVLNMFILLPLIPVLEVYDYLIPGEFSETGQHVEIGFAWITLKTPHAWLFYSSLFFWLGLIVGIAKHLISKPKTTIPPANGGF